MSKNRPVATSKSAVVTALPRACSDERAAVEFMEAQRWETTGPHCPRCGDVDVYQMTDRTTGERNARFLWRCRGCESQYTVRVGTIMEDSPIPLRHWCYAFWAACASKKGVSALQIQRMTGVTYKSALFMLHRIRFAMAADGPDGGEKLSGVVEFDETYVGGKPRSGARTRRADGRAKPGPARDFADRKTPVIAGVERNGRVKARVATEVRGTTLAAHLRDMVDTSAHLMTDENPSYKRVGREFALHTTVNHSEHEYARGETTTNRVEGFFATLKRGLHGTYHAVSRKHLHRYVSEFQFRYNLRSVEDGERTGEAIRSAEGRRLTYKQQLGRE